MLPRTTSVVVASWTTGPDVPITTTVKVPSGVPGVQTAKNAVPPPQAAHVITENRIRIEASSSLRLRAATVRIPALSAASHSHGPPTGPKGGRRRDTAPDPNVSEAPLVVTFTLTDTGLWPLAGAIEAGETTQLPN